MKKYFTTFTSLILAFCLATAVKAGDVKVGEIGDKIPVDSRIKIGKLDNGMTYYIRKNEEPKDRVEFRLVVKAGAFQEDDDQDGLAHMTEHMLFNGTKHFPKNELVTYLQSTGMSFGADINASTTQERTWYFLQLPTNDEEGLSKGMQVLEDWAHLVSFDNEEIDKERGVIIEEWRTRMAANRRVIYEHQKNLWPGTRYQLRNTIGADTNLIRNFKHDVIKRFYRDWYRPDLQAIVAVGDFDVNEMEKRIKKQFGKIPAKKNARPFEIYPIPKHKGIKVSIVQDPEYPIGVTQLSWIRDYIEPGTVKTSYDAYVRQLFDMMFNSRLAELARKADAPFLGAGAGEFRKTFGTRFFNIRAQVKPEGIARAYEASLTEAFRIKQHGFTQSELDRVKKETIKRMATYYSERDKTESGGLANEYGRNFLYKESIPGIEYEYAFVKKFLPKITLEEVNALANDYFIRNNLVVQVTAPEKAGLTLPSEKDFIAAFDKISNSKLEPYVDNVSDKPLFSKKLTPGRIIHESVNKDLGVTEIRFDNGVKVVMKPTDFKNNEIGMRAFSPGGLSLVKDKDYVSGMLSTNVVSFSGIGDFSQTELRKALSGKQVGVSPFISELHEGLRGGSTKEDFETMLQLTHMYFTDVREDKEAVASLTQMIMSQLENAGLNPKNVFQDSVSWNMDNHHFRSRPFSVDMAKEFNADKSYEIFRDRFADASDFTFFFVGSFDVDEMKKMTAKYLGSLPNKVRKEEWKGIKKGYPKGKLEKIIKSGEEEKSTVRVAFSGDYKYNRENNFMMKALSEALNIRLYEVIREEKSGTYGAYSFYNITHYPYEQYNFYIGFDCDTRRVDELLDAAKEQVAYLKKAPLDDKYMVQVKEIFKKAFEKDLKENSFWLGALYTTYLNNNDPDMLIKRDELIDKLTGKDIQEAAKKYLNYDNFAKFVLVKKDTK